MPRPPIHGFLLPVWLLYHTTDYIFESPSDLVSAQAIENYEIFVTIPHCSQFSALLI
jgi:hypothetical protein